MVFEVLSHLIGYLFLPSFAVFLVWSLDRVAKLCYLRLETPHYQLMTVVHTSNVTEKEIKFSVFHAINNFVFFP